MKVCDICKSDAETAPAEIKTVSGDAMGDLCDPCGSAVADAGFRGVIQRAVETAPPRPARRRSGSRKPAGDGAT